MAKSGKKTDVSDFEAPRQVSEWLEDLESSLEGLPDPIVDPRSLSADEVQEAVNEGRRRIKAMLGGK